MKRKVLFLIHDLGGGGAEKVLVNLVNHMDSSKYDITVASLFGGGVNERFLGTQVHYYSVWPFSIPGNSKIMKLFSPEALHKICVKSKYDVEISYLEGPSTRIISGCSDKNTKTIGWIHGQQHTKEQAANSFRNYKEFLNSYQKFDCIVCVSEDVRRSFKKIYNQSNNVLVRYNTIETDRILQMKDEAISKNIFNRNEFKLVAVGKITPNKGFDRMALIIKKLVNEGFPAHLYVLGEGEERKTILNYIEKNGLSEHYTFLGYQTNPYKYMAACDLFICASWSEGFSTATTEALIVGLPVCTVNVSGMKEMLGHNNEWGVVTDNNNESLFQGIKWLISDAERLEYYKKKAMERARLFSTENTVRAVEALIEEV